MRRKSRIGDGFHRIVCLTGWIWMGSVVHGEKVHVPGVTVGIEKLPLPSWSQLQKEGKLPQGIQVVGGEKGEEILKFAIQEPVELDLAAYGMPRLMPGKNSYDFRVPFYFESPSGQPWRGVLKIQADAVYPPAEGAEQERKLFLGSGEQRGPVHEWSSYSFGENRADGMPARVILKVSSTQFPVTLYLKNPVLSQGVFTPDYSKPTARIAVASEPSAWWTERDAGWTGGLVGALIGLLGGAAGVLAGLRLYAPARWMAGAIAFVGAVGLPIGMAVVFSVQPYHVWYPLVLLGVICLPIGGGGWLTLTRTMQTAELRRMEALDRV